MKTINSKFEKKKPEVFQDLNNLYKIQPYMYRYDNWMSYVPIASKFVILNMVRDGFIKSICSVIFF